MFVTVTLNEKEILLLVEALDMLRGNIELDVGELSYANASVEDIDEMLDRAGMINEIANKLKKGI